VRRLDDGSVTVPRSSLLHLVQRLDVDVGEAEHRDEQDDGEGRGIAGAPLLEGLALEVIEASSVVDPGPPPVSRLTMSNILKFSMPRNSTASIRNGSAIGR
jgi:hypothetical protein